MSNLKGFLKWLIAAKAPRALVLLLVGGLLGPELTAAAALVLGVPAACVATATEAGEFFGSKLSPLPPPEFLDPK